VHAGRDFDDRDTLRSPKVMIVNDAFVRRFFAGQNAVGKSLTVMLPEGGFSLGTLTIVGVVGDAVYHSLRERPRPALYWPLRQYGESIPQPNFYLAVQAAAPPTAALERSIAGALAAVHPDLTLKFEPIASVVDTALAQDRLVAMLSAFFGGLALLLAGLGLYGITSYAVGRRRIELGIRMALGAAPGTVVWLVLRRAAVLAGAGIAAGTIVSLWASRFVAAPLYGLGPRNPMTFLGAVLVLSGVAVGAGAGPAWRAARIDPAVTLRDE
jgi:putative ABC transport system permease protein